MFTFHWSELLVIILGGLVLLFGLAFLMLRRRNEVLEVFLTPEEPDLEQEFFRVRISKQEATEEAPPEEEEVAAESENAEPPTENEQPTEAAASPDANGG